MPITIKTADEIEKMRRAGRLAAEVLEMIAPHVRVGVTTDELDQLCHRYIVQEQQAIPAPLNYHGFPKSICTSVNHVVCHGIPSDRRLKNGDGGYRKQERGHENDVPHARRTSGRGDSRARG